jgi:hypothetical protein
MGSPDSLDPENFPEQLDALAMAMRDLLNCLNGFPQFPDEAVNESIGFFDTDLRVRWWLRLCAGCVT